MDLTVRLDDIAGGTKSARGGDVVEGDGRKSTTGKYITLSGVFDVCIGSIQHVVVQSLEMEQKSANRTLDQVHAQYEELLEIDNY